MQVMQALLIDLTQFLIQADFITSANREDVVECAWNDAICQGVAIAFGKAIETFATPDHPLRHSWLHYLPDAPMEKLWKPLYKSILNELRNKPVLETWENRQLKAPTQLRWLTWQCLFEDAPILPDLPDEIYPAPEYSAFGKELLEDLGVRTMTWNEMFPRLQADLVSRNSRIRTQKRDSPWYEAFATLGLAALKSSFEIPFKKQSVICLNKTNQWTGAPGMPNGGQKKIYFPTTGAVPIPDDIGLFLADRTASANPKVRKLYAALGVEECSKQTVYTAIEKAQASNNESLDIASHLEYYCRTGYEPSQLPKRLLVPTDRGPRPVAQSFYFASDSEYDMDQLLPQSLRSSHGLNCNIIPVEVIKLESSNFQLNDRTWLMWLQEATGARHYPRLTQKLSSEVVLSLDLRKILKLNPSKFLGTLRAHWSEYRHDALQIRGELADCLVLCISGIDAPLDITYLPTSCIFEEIDRLGFEGTVIPVLDLPDGHLAEDQYREWQFLEEFGVCAKPDLRFYRSALTAMNEVELAQVIRAYSSIARLATIEYREALR